MINPNRRHKVKATVTGIDKTANGSAYVQISWLCYRGTEEAKAYLWKGEFPSTLKSGDKVNAYFQFSIMSDCYTIRQITKRRG